MEAIKPARTPVRVVIWRKPIAPTRLYRRTHVAARMPANVATVAKTAPVLAKHVSAAIVAKKCRSQQHAVARMTANAATVAKTAPALAKSANVAVAARSRKTLRKGDA